MSHSAITLVTGGAHGIGKAVTQTLMSLGQTLVVLDKDTSALDRLSQELNHPDHLHCLALDICEQQTVTETINHIESTLGPIEQLAHCAGILKLGPLTQIPNDDFSQLLNVHLNGSFYLLQAVSQRMLKRQQGSIVVVGSNAASTPRKNMGAYCTSKAALHMLTKCFALELAEYGIRCNLVSPGSTRTNMQTQMWNEDYQEAQTIAGDTKQFRLGIPLNKIAEPQDIAGAVAFLLSDQAGHITMHDLRVDGGATLDQ